MSHIMVENAGELPIWGMRLLGLSNKTAEQIGKFGTGLKESIALLSRLDLLPVIYTGTCRVDFAVQGEPDEIHFRLSEDRDRFKAGEWYGLGMHPDFGKADWDDPWMVFREVVCNAIDESGVEGLRHDVSSADPEGVEGCTRVYIPVNPELLEAYSRVHRKILMLGEYKVAYDSGAGARRMIEKRRDEKLQVYHRGIWVQQGDRPSLFDYDLRDIELNESRSADWYTVNAEISRTLITLPVEMAGRILARLVEPEPGEIYEHTVLDHAARIAGSYHTEGWVEAWNRLYGPYAILTNTDKFFYDRLESQGKTPIVIKDDIVHGFLKAMGVPTPLDTLSKEDREYEVMQQPSEQEQSTFDRCWEMFVNAGLTQGRSKPGLMMFKPRAGVGDIVFGEYRNGICYMNLDASGSKKAEMACIEEIAHHITEAGDFNRAFQNFLVETIHRLGMEKPDERRPEPVETL